MIPLLFAIFLFTSCTSFPQPDPVSNRFGEADLAYRVNGSAHVGASTIPRSVSGYQLEFDLPEGVEVAIFRTCHRQVTHRRPGRTLSIFYVPALYLEGEDLCLATLETIDKSAVERLAILDFTDRRRLPARIFCNGAKVETNGAFLCQSAAGLIQRISFREPVVFASARGCPTMESKGAFTYEWTTGGGFCVYEFMAESGESFRLATYGFGGEEIW
jgi:hypothetical protein